MFGDIEKGVLLHVEIHSSKNLKLDKVVVPQVPIQRWKSLPEDMVAFRSRKNTQRTTANVGNSNVFVEVEVKNVRHKNTKFAMSLKNVDEARLAWLNWEVEGQKVRSSLNFFMEVNY